MNRVLTVLAILGGLVLAVPARAEQTDAKKKEARPEVVVFTNADLPPPLPTGSPAPSAVPPETAPAVPAAALPPLPTFDGYRDRNGHGEGWWRHRAAELDAEVLAARFVAEKLHVDYVKGKVIVDPTLPERSREATERLRELEAERDRLPEEMREAGGLPGWLRRGEPSLPSEPLPPPTPDIPAHPDGFVFSWKPVARAVFYLLEVQCLDCCGPLGPCDVTTLDVSTTRARLPFESGSTARWRVRALDAAGFGGAWSTWYDFRSGSN